jgi:hypothetical protein
MAGAGSRLSDWTNLQADVLEVLEVGRVPCEERKVVGASASHAHSQPRSASARAGRDAVAFPSRKWLMERGDQSDAVRIVGAACERLESGIGPAEVASARAAPGALRAARELLAAWVSDRPGR